MTDFSPYAQWFENTERKCVDCGKRATGNLRSHRNENLGPYCKRCAERDIKKAHRLGKFHPDATYEERAP